MRLEPDPARAMARDAAMLAAAERGEPGVRLYRWSRLCATLGRNQEPEAALLADIPYARRPTGGAAVLHGHDVTLAAALPIPRPRPPLRALYRALAELAAEMYRLCGVPVALAEELGREHRADSPYCFAGRGPADLLDPRTGEKLCGCALRVTRGAALLQTSMPVAQPEVEPSLVLRGATRPRVPGWDPSDLRPETTAAWRRLASGEPFA